MLKISLDKIAVLGSENCSWGKWWWGYSPTH